MRERWAAGRCWRQAGPLLAVSLTLALAGAALPTVAARAAEAASSADIAWAQAILKSRGFEVDRGNGQMTAKTKAAISAYQKSVGLPQTGDLDPGTVARLMQDHASLPADNLAAPPDRAHRKASPDDSHEPKPLAAPTGGVEAEGAGTGASTVLGQFVRSGPAGSRPEATDESGGPLAAPRGAIAVEGAANAPDGASSGQIIVPAWARILVLVALVGTLGGVGAVWLASGRRDGAGGATQRRPDGRPRRREPTFGLAEAPPTPRPTARAAGTSRRPAPSSATIRGGRLS